MYEYVLHPPNEDKQFKAIEQGHIDAREQSRRNISNICAAWAHIEVIIAAFILFT